MGYAGAAPPKLRVQVLMLGLAGWVGRHCSAVESFVEIADADAGLFYHVPNQVVAKRCNVGGDRDLAKRLGLISNPMLMAALVGLMPKTKGLDDPANLFGGEPLLPTAHEATRGSGSK